MAKAKKLLQDDVLHDKVWRMAAEGKSAAAIGRAFGKSPGWAWAIIRDRTKHMEDISSPEHKAANRAIVIDRVDRAAQLAWETAEACCEENGDLGTRPANLAICLKAAELRAKFTAVTDEMDASSILSVTRLEETARRLALIGPHSRASEMAPAVRAALSLAGIRPADAREVKE